MFLTPFSLTTWGTKLVTNESFQSIIIQFGCSGLPLIHRRHLPCPAIGPGLLSSPALFYFLLVDARQTQSGFLMNTLHPSWGLWESLPCVNPAMMWMSHNSQAHLVSWLLSYCFPKWLYWLTLLSAMLGGFCFHMVSAAPGIRRVHSLLWSC